MRRAFVVLVLLAMMVGLKALEAGTLTLAAIGFVVLAAFAVAELGARLQLPKVTGYIVSGVVLGPYAVQVLSDDVVGDMKMFSTLALGLIATSAGLELDLKGLRALAKTLATTVGIKVVLGIFVVGGVVVAGQLAFDVLPLDGTSQAIGLALIIGALSIGTSPAIALAIASETKAKGRLAELVLGAAVVKDVVVVVVLAIAIATAKAVTGGGAVGGGVLLHVAQELGASVLAGAVLGVLLIAYLRFVKAEMLLFVAAMVLVVAEVSAALHLELLLVFIVAGMTVRNFSKYEHDLLHPLETVSLPVFIVFFTNAGASVDLRATAAVLPLALAICVARALVYVVAGRVGGRAGGESEPVQRLAWLGYLPQAGVTLGLLGLAASQLPVIADSIVTVGMAVVAVNLLVGPVTLRVALRAAGEIPGSEAAERSTSSASVPTEIPQDAPWEPLEAEALRDVVRGLHEADQAAMRAVVAEHIAPWVRERATRLAEPMGEAIDRDDALAAIAEALDRLPPDDAEARVGTLLEAFGQSADRLDHLPVEISVPLEPRFRRAQPQDPFFVGWRKRWAAVLDGLQLRFSNRTRTIPVRAAARTVVEPRRARLLEEMLRAWMRVEVAMLEELRRCALTTLTAAETAGAIAAHAEGLVEDLQDDVVTAVDRTARALAAELAVIGSPTRSSSSVRYSKVEPELVRWRDRLVADGEAWTQRRDGAARLVHVTTEVAMIERRVRRNLDAQVIAVAGEAFDTIRDEVQGEHRRVLQIAETVKEAAALDAETVERTKMQISALVPRPAQKKLRTFGGKLRRATSGQTVSTIFRDAVVEQAGRETFAPSLATLMESPRPARADVVTLDVGEVIQGFLSAELAPRIEDLLGEIWSAYAAAREAMGNAEAAAEFVLTSATRDGEETPSPAELSTQLARCAEPLDGAGKAAYEAWEALREQVLGAIGGIDEPLAEAIGHAAGRTTAAKSKSPRSRRLRHWLETQWARRGEPLRELARTLWKRARGEAAHGIGRHYRLRSGAERADAADVRELLAERDRAENADLPQVYRALFAAEPVRDPRLFVANRKALQEVVRVERAWQQDPATGNAVLVVGSSGSGKSSLVQVARLKLATRRVIVVPTRDRVDEASLIAFIAREVGCTPDAEALTVALGRTRAAIVIDDLQGWIDASAHGVGQLDALLSLVVATRGGAFWLVSMPAHTLDGLETLIPIEAAFAQIIRLGRIDPTELAAVVDSRQQLSALSIGFPAPWRARVVGRLLRRSIRESFMRALASATGHNLRLALRHWRQLAHLEGESRVQLEPVGIVWGLPFLRQLSAGQLGVLSVLTRFGRRKPGELVAALGLPREHTNRELRFLVASGLVEEVSGFVTVPIAVRDDLASALAEFGALGGRS